jgi:hypothetical protein
MSEFPFTTRCKIYVSRKYKPTAVRRRSGSPVVGVDGDGKVRRGEQDGSFARDWRKR